MRLRKKKHVKSSKMHHKNYKKTNKLLSIYELLGL